jgi:hypothetical protein
VLVDRRRRSATTSPWRVAKHKRRWRDFVAMLTSQTFITAMSVKTPTYAAVTGQVVPPSSALESGNP